VPWLWTFSIKLSQPKDFHHYRGKENPSTEEEANEKEFEVEDHALVTLDVRKLLAIQRALQAKEVPLEPS